MQLSGNILDYFIVFGSGVLVSFTPCVYPVLPMTASFIGGINTDGSRRFGFLISLLYVLGMSITYAAFGIFAALSGKVFGQVQNHPVVFIIVANMLVFFALVMFDVIHLPVLTHGKHHKVRPKNLWAVFVFGLSSGLVVGPCTAPVLGTLLAYIASKQNIVNGVLLMFVFSYGVGASLILVGTFSGLLANLPKSGKWLHHIKRFCAVVLLILAQYYLVKAGTLMY